MARTRRSKKQFSYFRWPKTKAVQTAEHYAALEMEEAGFNPPPRQASRANPSSGQIVDAYDDIRVSANRETDHHTKDEGTHESIFD